MESVDGHKSEGSHRGLLGTHRFFPQVSGGCFGQAAKIPQDSGVESVTGKVCLESWVHWRQVGFPGTFVY